MHTGNIFGSIQFLTCFLVTSFTVAASYLASRPGTQRYTFGLERAESFAALISMILLVFLSIGLMWGAIHRLINIRSSDTVVDGRAMAVVGTIALFTNGILIYVLGEEGPDICSR